MELIKYGIFAVLGIIVFYKVYELTKGKLNKKNQEDDPILSGKVLDDLDFK